MLIKSAPTASRPSRPGAIPLATFVALVSLALLLPAIVQDPQYHLFADRRAWLGVPFAANVLSNFAFVAVGAFGLFVLRRSRRIDLTPTTVISVGFVAVGFVLTGIGSAWYHADPNDATLVWDRLPMTLVLAGIIAAAIGVRIGDQLAAVALPTLAVLGAASALYWRASGNLTPYAVFQFGGIAALIALLLATRGERDPFAWWWIVGWYCFAKAAELADRNVWEWTGAIVSGHTIKHLASATAGAAMFYSLRKR